MGQRIIDAEFRTGSDDLGLRQIDDRCVNAIPALALDGGGGGEVGEFLELLDIVMPAIRISGEVGGVDADEDVEGAEDFGPGQRVGEEDCVSCGDVGGGNLVEVAEV